MIEEIEIKMYTDGAQILFKKKKKLETNLAYYFPNAESDPV